MEKAKPPKTVFRFELLFFAPVKAVGVFLTFFLVGIYFDIKVFNAVWFFAVIVNIAVFLIIVIRIGPETLKKNPPVELVLISFTIAALFAASSLVTHDILDLGSSLIFLLFSFMDVGKLPEGWKTPVVTIGRSDS